MAKKMISEFRDGEKISSYFLVREKTKKMARNGKSYLDVDLMDASGTINGKVWDNADKIYECFVKGDAVAVRGAVDTYMGRIQLKIVDIRTVDERDDERLDRAELLPASPRDPQEMWAELRGLIESLEDEHYRALLEVIFDDEDMAAAFRNATAARDMHHNYIGGLIVHTLSVAAVASFLCSHYGDEINRDLVITGAVLHDIGKMKEINSTSDFNYTVEGSLKGHTIISLQIVRPFAEGLDGFPPAKLLLLEHIIISHQGQKEWSAPVEPKTPEAQLLHLADLTDARMFQVLRAVTEDTNKDDPFTPKNRALGRSILKLRDPEELEKWL